MINTGVMPIITPIMIPYNSCSSGPMPTWLNIGLWAIVLAMLGFVAYLLWDMWR